MKKVFLIGVIVLGLGALVFFSIHSSGGGGKSIKVYAHPAEQRRISQVVKAGGQLTPRVKVDISAHVVAKIEHLYVKEGDELVVGQPFLDLEKKAFLAARDRAEAQLAISRVQLREREVDLTDAKLKLRRVRRLAAAGIASAEQVEDGELRRSSAELRLEQLQEEIRRAEADLGKANDDLEKTTIYSPLSGRLIALNAEAGEVVVSGTMNNSGSVIGTVADLSEILLEVDVDETEIVELAIGQPAKVLVDALPNREMKGRVVEIGSSGYERSQQRDVVFFKVKVLLEDPDPRLKPSMSARAEIEVARRDSVLVVPIQSVVERPPAQAVEQDGGASEEGEQQLVRVALLIEDGKVVERPVELGLADATDVEVITGVELGEQVITGPYRALRDLQAGDSVDIRSEDSAASTAD